MNKIKINIYLSLTLTLYTLYMLYIMRICVICYLIYVRFGINYQYEFLLSVHRQSAVLFVVCLKCCRKCCRKYAQTFSS